ncbi:restriction endonuclease fold toxin [Paenibacillus sp. GbtcB18]|uniref:restriction endonuclease fold toxin n=1 Tax=Paenibacillus sp. GbtcB18 TaxID=2824763 RepID=UPI001C2F5EBD|nr:restriction endonuclease fold toxin [Paenibacillus sp. GbtcB18]
MASELMEGREPTLAGGMGAFKDGVLFGGIFAAAGPAVKWVKDGALSVGTKLYLKMGDLAQTGSNLGKKYLQEAKSYIDGLSGISFGQRQPALAGIGSSPNIQLPKAEQGPKPYYSDTHENYKAYMKETQDKAAKEATGIKSEGTGSVEDKLKLSNKARELMQKGHYSQAMDRHYEDLVRKKIGGKEVIYGEKGRERELDSVTKDAVIETKRSMSAVTKPDNFINKKMKQQLKATIQYAEEHGLTVEYWFKYGVHPKIRNIFRRERRYSKNRYGGLTWGNIFQLEVGLNVKNTMLVK